MRVSIILFVMFLSSLCSAQQTVLILTPQTDAKAALTEVRKLSERGIRTAVIVAPGCYIARIGAGLNTIAGEFPLVGAVHIRSGSSANGCNETGASDRRTLSQ
ncbi:MAG: hypothetical protein IPI55_05070 [Flavobacteriales bacterium]|nr:hypothetical protein [Flavobacteriales bacterium]